MVQGCAGDIAEGALSDEGEEGRHLGDEQRRLFQGGEVAATFGFIPVDDVAEAPLVPAPGGSLEFVGEHAATGRGVDVVTFVEWFFEPKGRRRAGSPSAIGRSTPRCAGASSA